MRGGGRKGCIGRCKDNVAIQKGRKSYGMSINVTWVDPSTGQGVIERNKPTISVHRDPGTPIVRKDQLHGTRTSGVRHQGEHLAK